MALSNLTLQSDWHMTGLHFVIWPDGARKTQKQNHLKIRYHIGYEQKHYNLIRHLTVMFLWLLFPGSIHGRHGSLFTTCVSQFRVVWLGYVHSLYSEDLTTFYNPKSSRATSPSRIKLEQTCLNTPVMIVNSMGMVLFLRTEVVNLKTDF